ncbi:hypothetical protein AK830_g405 [Neonectria ditissima]|uniref:Xylanolytic transcriptional activator regulatory domain-containing protein n=1 Tax=Neonectria ditissima TaxID=78410 RepID=A0A0P7BY78_9HYPO|nr:hypothetical protein AK830_g405 [Neonectria ditissima]
MASLGHLPTESPLPGADKRVSRASSGVDANESRAHSDSNGKSGEPPCRRCTEKNQQCVLATSRRGGRRVKRLRASHSMPREHPDLSASAPSRTINIPDVRACDEGYDGDGDRDRHVSDDQSEWSSLHITSELDQPYPASDQDDNGESRETRGRLEGHITSADLLNPSDALDLLAQVADLETGGREQASETVHGEMADPGLGPQTASTQHLTYYPPISSGALAISDASALIQQYHTKFHLYFPIAYKAVFDEGHISEWIDKEQHLVTAILTVVTKDDPTWLTAHEACARHMETLISKLIYAGSTTVGAVEALLILAEWAPQPPEDSLMIGCGKEDQGSWMLVGIAIRLAYLQNLEQTTLTHGDDGVSEYVCRQRTVWAACYMSDRQVSIRLGKGFWSRGPGPSISLRAADFPSLRAQKLGNDDFALLFQAHLEITQLFSNAHDMLYSSTDHREQLYAGGEYVRYIDDLSAVLRRWKLAWGGLSFVPLAKASLMLCYDFLRLYINAFAFQANLYRAVRRARGRMSSSAELKEPLFSDLAGAPDARFIYESIDAANSLLCTLNSFINPETGLKFMPLKFYLYIIYAAVFLFKAILSGAIKSSDAVGIRRTIHETILRLQKTSTSRQGLGQRYARSLRLLWQKSVGRRKQRAENVEAPGERSATTIQHAPNLEPTATGYQDMGPGLDPLNSFSWKNLDSLGQFITCDLVTLPTDGMITTPELDSVPDLTGVPGMDTRGWYNGFPNASDVIF